MKNKSSFWKYIKSRLPIFVIIICIITAAVASGVMGKYVADKNDEADFEVIAEPKLNITVTPDGSGNYRIANAADSNMPAYIRFTVVVNWINDNFGDGVWFVKPEINTDYTLTVNGCSKVGDYYYYNGTVAVDSGFDITVSQINPSDDFTLQVQVIAEGFQSVPDSAVRIAWGATYDKDTKKWVEN